MVVSDTKYSDTPVMGGDLIALVAGSPDSKIGLDIYDKRGNRISTLAPALFDQPCMTALIHRPDGVDIAIVSKVVNTPAQGVVPAHRDQTLAAYDARKMGSPLWETPVAQNGAIGFCIPGHDPLSYNLAKFVEPTADGAKAVIRGFAGDPHLLDTMTGQISEIPGMSDSLREPTLTVVGNYLFVDDSGPYNDGAFQVIDASTNAVIGKTVDADLIQQNVFFPVRANLMVIAGNGKTVQGMTLPSLTPTWSNAVAANGDFPSPINNIAQIDATTGNLIFSGLSVKVRAVNPDSGETQWELDAGGQVCAIANGEVMVYVNGQMAYLGAATGKQLRYVDVNSQAGCPTMLDMEYGFRDDGKNVTITREL